MSTKKVVEGEVVPRKYNYTMKTGRPPKLTEDQRIEFYNALENYINLNVDPTIVGFISLDPVALQYNVTDVNIYDWQEFSVLRNRAIKKQEWYLLQGGGTGRYNPTMAIFRLKQPQHGYTDKTVQEHQIAPVTPLMQLQAPTDSAIGDSSSAESVSVDDLVGSDE